GRKSDPRRPFDSTRTAFPLSLKRERLRRFLLLNPDLPGIAALESGDAHLEPRVVAIFASFFQLLASLDALLQDRGIDERREDFLLRNVEFACGGDLHPRLGAGSRASVASRD